MPRQNLQPLVSRFIARLKTGVHGALALVIIFSAANASAQQSATTGEIERAAALISENRLDEAEKQLNTVLKLRPNEASALNLLGTVRAKQGKLDDAELLFTRAVRADGRLVGARMNLAYLYLLKNAPDKSANELKEVLRLDPSNSDANYRLAWVLFSQGHLDECIGVIDRARQTQPVSPVLLDLLGDAYLRKGVVEKAEEAYLLALHEQEMDPDALIGLACVYQSKGNRDILTLYLRRAREVISNSPDRLYKFATVALRADLVDDSIAALKQAIGLKPEEPSYFFALGLGWVKKSELDEAERAFRRSLALRPNDAQSQLYLGYILLKEKRNTEARDLLEKSLETESGIPETYYYLGLIAEEQSENERAVQLFEKSIQLSPSFGHPHIALGSALVKMKNYERAQQELEIGVKLNPNDSKAHYNLALLYSRLKDTQRANAEMDILERLKSPSVQNKEGELIAPSSPRPR
jgi:tetratricopeptide (TPR) repeat protein